jgi:hypothetical protein
VNGSGIEHDERSNDDSRQEYAPAPDRTSEAHRTAEPGTDACNSIPSSLVASDEVSSRMERLSQLGSSLGELLLELSHEVKSSTEQLHGILLAIDLKKKELKTLHEIDASAASLKQLIEEHRLERESFERLMENQRNIWEEEKAHRALEEKEYVENLKIQRQQEEEKFKHAWAAEQQEARQKMDKELYAVQQISLEKQSASERELQDREKRLQDKEQEWERLIQEMELLMSRLSVRAQSQSAAGSEEHKKANITQPDPPTSPVTNQKETHTLKRENVSNTSFFFENPLTGERILEKTNLPHNPSSDSFFKIAFMEEPKPLLSSLKEILQSHGRRIENAHADFSLKRDCTTLKFSPKKTSHSKSEI